MAVFSPSPPPRIDSLHHSHRLAYIASLCTSYPFLYLYLYPYPYLCTISLPDLSIWHFTRAVRTTTFSPYHSIWIYPYPYPCYSSALSLLTRSHTMGLSLSDSIHPHPNSRIGRTCTYDLLPLMDYLERANKPQWIIGMD